MSPPKVVHAQEDIGLSPNNCYFDGAYKVPGGVWRSNAEPVVRLSLNRATRKSVPASRKATLRFALFPSRLVPATYDVVDFTRSETPFPAASTTRLTFAERSPNAVEEMMKAVQS
jgi:hypothetical protein